jgi:hypothetical protein
MRTNRSARYPRPDRDYGEYPARGRIVAAPSSNKGFAGLRDRRPRRPPAVPPGSVPSDRPRCCFARTLARDCQGGIEQEKARPVKPRGSGAAAKMGDGANAWGWSLVPSSDSRRNKPYARGQSGGRGVSGTGDLLPRRAGIDRCDGLGAVARARPAAKWPSTGWQQPAAKHC